MKAHLAYEWSEYLLSYVFWIQVKARPWQGLLYDKRHSGTTYPITVAKVWDFDYVAASLKKK